MNSKIILSPSLICCDLCNLEQEVENLEHLGVDSIHIDLIDSHFSPSMPIGIDTVRQLRAKTNIDFDIHLMVTNNDLFVGEMVDIGVKRICFHYEGETHVDRLLDKVKNSGVEVGIALNPATALSSLEYCLDKIDYVLLMLINPGFAGQISEKQVTYAERKVKECYQYLKDRKSNIAICVDGRVSFEVIPALVSAGADMLVLGSTSLFHSEGSIGENLLKVQKQSNLGLAQR